MLIKNDVEKIVLDIVGCYELKFFEGIDNLDLIMLLLLVIKMDWVMINE